jgi:1-phosphofructokinase family hexose kinase
MIYTVTLNPAVDKIIFLDEFIRAKTGRIKKTVETLGGKGTHVSINLKLLGVENTALGVTLGENGKKITKMMEEWGVSVKFLHYDIPGLESRTNYEIIEELGNHCTMLSERGPMLAGSITDDLLEQIKQLLQPEDILMLTGDASNVQDTAIYTKLTGEAKILGAKVVLDASGPYLVEGLKSKPYLIKPNFEELCFIAGRELKTERDVVDALESIEGVPVIAMTWSGNGSVVKFEDKIYRVYPVEARAVNEAGCGDAFLSAIIAGLEKGQELEEILKWATSVAGACVESEITTGFDLARARQLKEQAKTVRLK